MRLRRPAAALLGLATTATLAACAPAPPAAGSAASAPARTAPSGVADQAASPPSSVQPAGVQPAGLHSPAPIDTAAKRAALAAAARRAAVSSLPTETTPCGVAASPPPVLQHVVWIVLENKTYSSVIGSSAAPYLTSLAKRCGNAVGMVAETHPSLPNYLAMTSGSTHGVTDDAGPGSHPLSGSSIFSQAVDWRALQESMPSACYRGKPGLYAVRHNPAAYYTGLDVTCGLRDVALTSTPDLSARFTFVTPNLCHDMHNCSVATGDAWMKGFLPKVIASPQYQSGSTAVFITFDENDRSAGNHIPTIVVTPSVKPGTAPTTTFNHYSMLRTTEEMLGIPTYLGGAATARSMRAAFNS